MERGCVTAAIAPASPAKFFPSAFAAPIPRPKRPWWVAGRCTHVFPGLVSVQQTKIDGPREVHVNRKIWRLTASFAVIGGALAGFAAWAETGPGLRIDVLSSRPELVSGGDALVAISGIEAAPKVTVGTNDVSAAFKPDAKGGWVAWSRGSRTAITSWSRTPAANRRA